MSKPLETPNTHVADFDRLPPHSVESEMCVLCAMITHGKDRIAINDIRSVVNEFDFFTEDHRILFRAIDDLFTREKGIDAMLVREELIRRHQLEDMGGVGYLAEILASAPNYENGIDYAKTVKEKSILRSVITVANKALRAAHGASNRDRSMEICRGMADELVKLATEGTLDPVVTLADASMAVTDRRHKTKARRIPTRIQSLDGIIGGIVKGKFTIIGADPRVGKSTLIKQILKNVAGEGIRCGLVTIEEDQEKVSENMLANESGIANHKIAYGQMSREDWDKVELASHRFVGTPYYIDDKQSKLDDVVMAVERLASKYGCEMIAVDHLHLINSYGRTREEEISNVSKALKAVFKRTGVAGMAAAQLNRGQEAKDKPILRSLRGSGSLEADGDCIMLLFREDVIRYQDPNYTATGIIEVNVAKNKDGPMGEMPLAFSGERQSVTHIVDDGPCGGKDPF